MEGWWLPPWVFDTFMLVGVVFGWHILGVIKVTLRRLSVPINLQEMWKNIRRFDQNSGWCI